MSRLTDDTARNTATDEMRRLHVQAAGVSRHVRLALQHRTWKGTIGNWAGAGTGSSIDFQDHRPYLPGDDPRYIDWAAYARSGHYIMKLYREEVSPRVDLILDVSRSMQFDPSKHARALELLYFCVESILALGGALSCRAACGTHHELIPLNALLANAWHPPEASLAPEPPDFRSIPLRTASLRLFISDLLFDAAPDSILRPLSAGKGRILLLAPYTSTEADPDWSSNVEFVDCETQSVRRQRVNTGLIEQYTQAYTRHFDTWRDQARRYNARFARVPAEPALAEALRAEALANGVVEAWT